MPTDKRITHCPIHPDIPIRAHPEKYGSHKDEMMGWCPKCDVKFPVELSYQDLLRFYINLKRSHDELGSILQIYEEWVQIVRRHLINHDNAAYAKEGELLRQATERGLYWSKEGEGNIMELIYVKAKQAVIDDLRGEFSQYFDDNELRLPEEPEEES